MIKTIYSFIAIILFPIGAFASPLSDAILSLNPTGYWRFEESSGTTAIDATGNNNGVYNGSGFSLGANGAAVNSGSSVAYNGTNSYMSVNNVAIKESFTIFAWARSNTSAWNQNGWIASARVPNGFIVHADNASRNVGMYILNSSCNTCYTRIGTATVNDIRQWHQYGMVYDAATNQASVILDGQIISTTGYSGHRDVSSTISMFAGLDMCCGGDRFGDGAMDELAVFGQALTAQQINTVFAVADNPAAAIPEANSMVLLLIGIVGCCFWRKG